MTKKVVFIFLAIMATVGSLLFFHHSLYKKIAVAARVEPKSEPVAAPVAQPKKNRINLIEFNKIPEKELLAKIVAATPMISTKKKIGTGFLVARNGFILTDLHVVGLESTLDVVFYSVADDDENVIEERSTVKGTVIAWSQNNEQDLALIKIDPKDIPSDVIPLELAEVKELNKAQPVWRFGYNDGYHWSYGFFTPNHDDAPRSKVLMPMSAGASGGPIVTMKGQVVGILQQGKDGAEEIIVQHGARRTNFLFPLTSFLPVDEINSFITGQPLRKHKIKK